MLNCHARKGPRIAIIKINVPRKHKRFNISPSRADNSKNEHGVITKWPLSAADYFLLLFLFPLKEILMMSQICVCRLTPPGTFILLKWPSKKSWWCARISIIKGRRRVRVQGQQFAICSWIKCCFLSFFSFKLFNWDLKKHVCHLSGYKQARSNGAYWMS